MNRINLKTEKACKEDLKQYFSKHSYILYESEYGKLKLSQAVDYIRIHLNGEWIINKIMKAQCEQRIREHKFQAWHYELAKTKRSWSLIGASANRQLLYDEEFLFSNFALRSTQLWKLPGDILIMPQEM